MESGDYVSLKLARKSVKGIVLESYDGEVVLLKLDSGYNIGIPKLNIHGSKVIRKFKKEREEFPKLDKQGKPKIGLIVAGGTIASKLNPKTGGVSALTKLGEFAKFYPKLFEKCNVEVESPFMMMSESMSFSEWKIIAESVGKMLKDDSIEGVIVTQGTDTLHYTSAALSFFLDKLNKPVVLTFSQRSADRPSSDAEFNLNCAAHMALSNCAEVMIVGHATIDDNYGYALRGTKVRKMHTSRRDAFAPINTEPIAKVWEDGKIEFISEYKARNKDDVKLDDKFSDKVALVKFYPGMNPDLFDYYKSKGYKAIIVEMVGLGQVSVSGKNSLLPVLKKLIKSGIYVFATAQTIYGALNPKVYSQARELEKAGVIYLKDMLSETALVKLGWVLGHKNWKVKEKMLENIAGEFKEVLNE